MGKITKKRKPVAYSVQKEGRVLHRLLQSSVPILEASVQSWVACPTEGSRYRPGFSRPY